MITINAAPIENRILLDANNTIISLTSSNGAGYYFRALIYVDDELFDEQGWSRKDDFTAEKDLKKLYNAYYESVFNNNFSNGLFEQFHLKKKISIVIREHKLIDDTVTALVTLPDFFFIFNTYPSVFNDETKVQFLGIDSEILLIPKNGKIAIPFMVNAENEALSVTLKNNFETTINVQSLTIFTGKKIFLYHFDLSTATLIANTIFFTLKISVGSFSISKSIRLLRLPEYPVKELAFLNNFGFWNYAYFDGKLVIDSMVDPSTYEEFDGTEKVFEITEKETFTLNTGSLLSSEKKIINQVQKALQAKFYMNGEWLEMVNQNKKSNLFTDRNNSYSENLSFSLRRNASVKNTALAPVVYDMALELVSAEFEIVEDPVSSGINIACEIKFNALEPEEEVILHLSKDGIETMQNVSVMYIDATMQYFIYYGFPLGSLTGTYSVKVQSFDNTSIFSNSLNATV